MMSTTDEDFDFLRRLDETNGGEGEETTADDGEVLRASLRVYGSIFIVLFTIFLILRRVHPRLYNIRSWSPKMRCELAEDQHGILRWVWELWFVKDDVILDQCGLDALCFLRVLYFGFKLAFMGMLNAIWLMPVYATSKNADMAPSNLVRVSTSYLPPGSNRFIATVVAAYVIFLFTFYLILKEFEWYTKFRHKFLMQKTPRNYAVYVTGIPEEYRSSYALKEYFRQCFSKEGVLEAHVAMEIPELSKKVASRKALVKNLEHALNLEKLKGIKAVHQSISLSSGKMQQQDAVEVYQEQLEQLNEEISDSIRKIRFVNDRMQDTFGRTMASRYVLGVEMLDDEQPEFPMFTLTAPSDSPSLRRRRLSSLGDLPDMPRQRLATIDSTPHSPFSDGSSGSSFSSHGFVDDIETGMDDDQAEYEDTVPPTTGIFQSDVTEHTIPHSVLSSSPDTADQGAVFFGTELSTIPRGAEPANAETMPSPVAEQSLPTEQGKEDVSLNATTIPDDADTNEPFQCPMGSAHTRIISEGDCVNELCSSESENDVSHDTGPSPRSTLLSEHSPEIERPPADSPLVHQSSSKKSLRIMTQLSQDVTSIATRAVMGGSGQVRNLVVDGSGQVARVAKDGSQHVKKAMKEINTKNLKRAADLGAKNVMKAKDLGVTQILKAKDMGVGNVKNLASFVLGNGDGTPRDAGFVVFTKLSTTHAALQMIHHPEPFVMEVTEAPEPHDVFWRNVGMQAKSRQVGNLASLGLSTLLCFFWTIPVSFIASLTEVSSLRASVVFIDDMLNAAPWLEPVLAQLAPLLLQILNALLPAILREFTKVEGHIASSAVEASLFIKMATFMIIQTFFVSALSGTVWAELSNMLMNPGEIVDLLARSLPNQSTFFLQIILVNTFLGLSVELLRVIPLSMAWLRRRVGPNLTEKERNTVYMGIRPLSRPEKFRHAEVFGQAILYFMVFFVYSTIAPITSFFLAFCFLLTGSGYRNQFFYNYPTTPDSGGKLWSNFISVSLGCVLVAQITLTGFLALKKSPLAFAMMFPLIGITILFNLYIHMQHFVVTRHLPTRDCLQLDRKHFANGGLDFSFVRNKYLHPALLERVIHSTVSPMDRGLGEYNSSSSRRVSRRVVKTVSLKV